jgi:hypothetical protein
MRKFYQTMKPYAWSGLFLLLWTPALFSQTVTLRPTCGAPGTKVCIGGSGWAEPNPLCRYLFTFDSMPIAPDQQDGLYGPPSTNFIVPSVADGNHTVLVQLVLDDDSSTLLQQQSAPFTVSSTIANPFNPAPANTYGGIAAFTATFDPTNVCDAGPCKNIRFIQVKQPTGRLAADHSKVRNLTHAEQKFPQAAKYDADLTAAGYSVDVLVGNPDPYYQFPIPGKSLSGNTTSTPATAGTMGDKPGRSNANYPADIDRIILNFEVAAICVDGDLKGTYLGTTTWTWAQDKGGTPTVSLGGTSRGQPSQNFLDAVSKWDANHSYTSKFPTPNVQMCLYN